MIIFIIFFLLGTIISSFTLISSAVILFFGIPETRRKEKVGMLIHPNPIIKNYSITAFLLLASWLIWLGLLYNFGGSEMIVGFTLGSLVTLFFSIGNVGRNPNNLSDYLQRNKRYFIRHDN